MYRSNWISGENHPLIGFWADFLILSLTSFSLSIFYFISWALDSKLVLSFYQILHFTFYILHFTFYIFHYLKYGVLYCSATLLFRPGDVSFKLSCTVPFNSYSKRAFCLRQSTLTQLRCLALSFLQFPVSFPKSLHRKKVQSTWTSLQVLRSKKRGFRSREPSGPCNGTICTLYHSHSRYSPITLQSSSHSSRPH